MARSLCTLVVILLTLTLGAGCGPRSDRTEAACRNMAELPARARADVVDRFAVNRCRFGTGDLCRALGAYLAEADTPALDPARALALDTPNDEAMAVLAEGFRDVEEDMGADRARVLNRAVTDGALALGGERGRDIARAMQMMPGGSNLVTVRTRMIDLAALRVALEQTVDLCWPG